MISLRVYWYAISHGILMECIENKIATAPGFILIRGSGPNLSNYFSLLNNFVFKSTLKAQRQ